MKSLSLRARFTLVVLGGAIVPLALIGAWLSDSTARSGRELLRTELDSSVTAIARRVQVRWQDRAGDLALLANNDATRRLLQSDSALVGATNYLTMLARDLRPTIREFTYRGLDGRARWSSTEVVTAVASAGGTPGADIRRAFTGLDDNDALSVRRSVVDEHDRILGFVDARVLLSAILPIDSLQLIVAGAALRIRNRETNEAIGGMPAALGSSLVFARATLVEPPLDLELVASDARYVRPFARAAKLGLVAVFGVAALALVLTAFLARRLTAALEQIAHAADAIAAGDLERTVEHPQNDEVGRLAAAFNKMSESLRRTLAEVSSRESLVAVGRFAASMSHEVRNALTGVRLDLQRLRERTPADSPDRDLITRSLRNVQRLDAIVTGSLRVARVNPETMRSVALEGIVRGAMTAAQPGFDENGARVVLELQEGPLIRVRGDPAALEQAFLNLLLNAAQAMTTPGGLARISMLAADERATVRIADTGSGIPIEAMARIGEPFMSSKPKGTGLGLPIARQIVLAHGGDISVATTGPEGTTIEVILPTDRAMAVSPSAVPFEKVSI